MAAINKFLHFHDDLPLKIHAKAGNIAERVSELDRTPTMCCY
jgi:hypothetical protein